MSLFDFFLITFSALCVIFMVFLWRRGAVDTTKAEEAVKDFADDTRKGFAKWRDDLEKK